MNGSNHEPNWGAVDVNVLAWGPREAAFAMLGDCSGVAGDILSPWRAVRSEGACRFILIELIPDSQVANPEKSEC